MEIPNSFFEDEVRDGFFIPAKMKRYWAGELEVLSQIDTICKRHGIRYFAHYGTLLGAVRHGGFIPWDDDLDLCMERSEADRFLEYAKEELPEGSLVLTYDEEDYSNLLLRVVNSRQICFGREFLLQYHGCPYPQGVDIFVLDHAAPTQELDELQCAMIRSVFELSDVLEKSMGLARREQVAIEDQEIYKRMEAQTDILQDKLETTPYGKLWSQRIDRTLPLRTRLHLIAEAHMRFYNGEKTGKLVDMGNHIRHGGHTYPAYYFEELTELPFEYTRIPVSSYYDAMLSDNYGMFMNTVRGTAGHGYPVYRKMDAVIRAAGREAWQETAFAPDLMKAPETACPDHTEGQWTSALAAAAGRLYWKLCRETDPVQAQTCAIELGELLEGAHAEGEVIPCLEAYCEEAYELYARLEGKQPEAAETAIREWTAGAEARLRPVAEHLAAQKSRRRLLLISRKPERYYTEGQPGIELFYVKAETLYKDAFGNDCARPEGTSAVEYTVLTTQGQLIGENIPPEALYPDVILTDEPYEDGNPGYRISGRLYPGRLRATGARLVILQGQPLGEIRDEEDTAYITLSYLACTTGSEAADEILVQSESMKAFYASCLTAWSGESYAAAWEGKLSTYDRLASQYGITVAGMASETATRNPVAVATDRRGITEKNLCFHVGVSLLTQYRDIAIAKLDSVLRCFGEADRIKALWVMTPEEHDYVIRQLPEIAEAIEVMKQYSDRVEFTTELTGEEAFSHCVAYYGDAGSLAHRFAEAHKPVMLMDFMTALDEEKK